jgi:prolyl oligopeptidase PreP (S9A serine peptidase family)
VAEEVIATVDLQPEELLVPIDTDAGHGLGKPVSKQIDERADVLAFLELALGSRGARSTLTRWAADG